MKVAQHRTWAAKVAPHPLFCQFRPATGQSSPRLFDMVSTSAAVLETHDIGEYGRVRSTGRGCRRGYLFLDHAGLIGQLHGKRKPHSGPLSEERIQESNPRSNCVEFRAMHERIRLINHLGKKILLVDLSNCPVN